MSQTLRLNPRQRAMLAEMGIPLWDKPPVESAPAPAYQERSVPVFDAITPKPIIGQVAQVPAPIPYIPSSIAPLREPRPSDLLPAPPPQLTPLPPPETIAAMDWIQLEATVNTCRACALHAGRHQAVFGIGNRQADWMIVGEAPGEHEDIQGEPFVGPAGKLLNEMLMSIGVSRYIYPSSVNLPRFASMQGVYIANSIKCRPSENRNPTPSEVTCCRSYLERQVALVKPKIILALGRYAVQSLLHIDDPIIGRLRGHVHHYQDIPLIVTYHPSYLLRKSKEPMHEKKEKSWKDLCFAHEIANEK
jgi:DNA polymerase